MHSKDPNKQSGPLFEAFSLEFEKILEDAGEGEANFHYFVFPLVDFRGRKFQANCRFVRAIFTQDADFDGAIFMQGADFNFATFTQKTDFSKATFTQNAIFVKATFTQNADFYEAKFVQDGDFSKATFTQNAVFVRATFAHNANFFQAIFLQNTDFYGVTFTHYAKFHQAIFTQNADFRLAIFMQNADFSWTNFTQNANFFHATFSMDAEFSRVRFTNNADFNEATFTRNALFGGTIFTHDVGFSGATFTQEAQFSTAIFNQQVDFSNATFTQAARFVDTNFRGTVNWRRCRFLDGAEFRRTKFDPQVAGQPSAVFALACFANPCEIVFDDVDLSRAIFHNRNVSQVWFTSSVQWGKREGNRGLAVFEETIDLEQKFGGGLKRDGQRDYRAVAQIYQQLKKNYDSRLDYWTANDFHYGEMEMKRLAGPTDGPLLGLRRWLHRRLSLVALYRYASDYGNSYGKPMLWLLGILVLFAALLPLPGVGLKRQGARQAETYASAWRVGDGWGPNLWAEARLAGKGAITSVDAATFQKSAEYAPNYPWGRVLAIFETLLTSSLFALFLLAIRRQFRR